MLLLHDKHQSLPGPESVTGIRIRLEKYKVYWTECQILWMDSSKKTISMVLFIFLQLKGQKVLHLKFLCDYLLEIVIFHY